MTNLPERQKYPELVFGLVAPIGVDLDAVTTELGEALEHKGYSPNLFRVTKLMRDFKLERRLSESPYIESFQDRISYANEIRKRHGDDALALLAISAIRSRRNALGGEQSENNSGECERPIEKQAYIIRQLKRPEEIALLRRVYGRQFIIISAYASPEDRQKTIEDAEFRSRGGVANPSVIRSAAAGLIEQDEKETYEQHGQNVRDAFPFGDVFIDATTRKSTKDTLDRFINLLFGNNQITPNADEYGLYMAKTASNRSSDLSRQVGAALFGESGEIISMGCNETPKAGGGTYWDGDLGDARDFVRGRDPNDDTKNEVLIDLIQRLKSGGHLAADTDAKGDAVQITQHLLDMPDGDGGAVSKSKIMDLIEFGRIIHAEMAAICDAARTGTSIKKATLYSTTFPCHLCAKHIVAAGIMKVVFLEPYPKSYAARLHSDAIAVGPNGDSGKVLFTPFIGVSPYRYRDLFEKGRRKTSNGEASRWSHGEPAPMVDLYFPSYMEAEMRLAAAMRDRLSPPLNEAETGS